MPLSQTALESLLRLALVPGVGPGRLARLVRAFGSADRVLGASAGELGRVPGVGVQLVRGLRCAGEPAAAEQVTRALRAMERVGAVALTPDDLAFPRSFGQLADAPYLVFAAGELALLGTPGIAVVGTRQPTPYGRETAAALSAAMGTAGYTVVSGMAKGIDATAHIAVLDAGGGTVGVLGHGIDRIYPAENRRLFERMRSEGLLLTEMLPGEQPRAGNFPRRNRLIAALSLGVLVVEMGSKSGAQHTVNFALEQGREIFAVPGPIASAASSGTNQLIKDGARVVTSADDILEELEGVGRESPRRDAGMDRPLASAQELFPAPAPSAVAVPNDLSADETRVFGALAVDARHVDELSAAAELAPGNVLGALLGLELRGLVESLPGKHFRRAQP